MHPDVAALLAVQDDDIEIHGLEERLAALMPRLEAMAKEQERAARCARSGSSGGRRGGAATARRARPTGPIQGARGAQPGAAQCRHQRARGDRGDGAARSGAAHDRRGERELDSIVHRLADLRHGVTERDHALRDIERAQKELRASLDADRAAIDEELAKLRARRNDLAAKVPRSLAHAIRPHPLAQTSARGFSTSRQLVRELRYGDSAAAAQRDDRQRCDGDLRRLRSASVRGRMMLVRG